MPTARDVLKKYAGKTIGWALGRLVDSYVKKAKEQPILADEMLLRIRLVQAFMQERRGIE